MDGVDNSAVGVAVVVVVATWVVHLVVWVDHLDNPVLDYEDDAAAVPLDYLVH